LDGLRGSTLFGQEVCRKRVLFTGVLNHFLPLLGQKRKGILAFGIGF